MVNSPWTHRLDDGMEFAVEDASWPQLSVERSVVVGPVRTEGQT